LDEHVAGQPLQLVDHDPVALVVLQGVEDVGPAVALGGGASGPGRGSEITRTMRWPWARAQARMVVSWLAWLSSCSLVWLERV
jgi:hypothetical protein